MIHWDLVAAARDVRVLGADTLRIDGHTFVWRDADPPEVALGSLLYRYWYLRPGRHYQRSTDLWAEQDFQLALVRANTSTGRWESGWRVEAVEADGTVQVRGDVVRLWAPPGRFRNGLLRVPGENRGLLPGFYRVVGEAAWGPGESAAPTVRLYWNIESAGAAHFVAQITHALNEAQVPFRAKVPNTPSGYQRPDAGVIYVARQHFADTQAALNGIDVDLEDDVPRFTKRLRPGLGVAEDPDNGLSFGQHRCRLVARGLWETHQAAASPVEAIAAAFEEEGLDPGMPHLSAGSVDAYDWRHVAGAALRRPRTCRAPKDFLGAAMRVGRGLCESAIWHHGACNWLGRANPHEAGPQPTPRVAALKADLYGGLAGVALLLAELFTHTDDAAFAETARGAMRAAARQLTELPSVGFYTGVTGVAYAAGKVGVEFPEPLLLPDDVNGDDLLGGRAGAIMALLALGDVPRASDIGDALVHATPRLTGLSHGAAGIGLALLCLHAHSRSSIHLEAGRSAFAFEDRWFDEAEGNWPDFRPSADAAPGSRFMVAWCHGAPGIALSRLRAADVDPVRSERYLAQARVALDTTQRTLERRPQTATLDATLCHGTAGLIETLLVASVVLDDQNYGHAARHAGLTLLDQDPSSLSSGTLCGGPNPSLLLGLAGVGYQFLRLHDPQTVPTLLAGPWLPAPREVPNNPARETRPTRTDSTRDLWR